MIPLAHGAPLVDGGGAVLAEAGQCMEGDIGLAVRMVREAAEAGAWGFKTQLLRPDTIATAEAGLYWHDDLGNLTQRQAFARAGLIGYDEWTPVRDECWRHDIAFVATPFDLEAVAALDRLQVDAYKIASGDLLWWDLWRAILATGRPIIVSTGAASGSEVVSVLEAVARFDPAAFRRMVVLACSLVYPTPAHAANVGRIVGVSRLLAAHGWPALVGYSDHTTVPWMARYAAAAGSALIEKHYTYAGADGPVADHGMAVDPTGLGEVVRCAARGAAAYGSAVLAPTGPEMAARHGARRGLYARHTIEPGTPVEPSMFVALRPLPPTGVSPLTVSTHHDLGQRIVATRRIREGEPLLEADVVRARR